MEPRHLQSQQLVALLLQRLLALALLRANSRVLELQVLRRSPRLACRRACPVVCRTRTLLSFTGSSRTRCPNLMEVRSATGLMVLPTEQPSLVVSHREVSDTSKLWLPTRALVVLEDMGLRAITTMAMVGPEVEVGRGSIMEVVAMARITEVVGTRDITRVADTEAGTVIMEAMVDTEAMVDMATQEGVSSSRVSTEPRRVAMEDMVVSQVMEWVMVLIITLEGLVAMVVVLVPWIHMAWLSKGVVVDMVAFPKMTIKALVEAARANPKVVPVADLVEDLVACSNSSRAGLADHKDVGLPKVRRAAPRVVSNRLVCRVVCPTSQMPLLRLELAGRVRTGVVARAGKEAKLRI